MEIAKGFAATIRIRHGQRAGDAKSLIALLNLGIESGATVRVMAEGPDAREALDALRDAIEQGLEEEEEAAGGAPEGDAAPIAWEGATIAGVAAAPGIAMGPIWHYQRGKIVVAATARDPAAELTRLARAIESAKRELAELFEEVRGKAGAGRAAIFKAHAEFLDDQGLIDAAQALIRTDARSAGYAWEQSINAQARALAAQPDALLAARAVDLRDVGRRVLRLLAERIEDDPRLPETPVILLADDLSPSDTARLDPALALGICTAAGGPTSHTAIIARSLDIPAVVGAGDAVLDLEDGAPDRARWAQRHAGHGSHRGGSGQRRAGPGGTGRAPRGRASRLLSAGHHDRRRPHRGRRQHRRARGGRQGGRGGRGGRRACCAPSSCSSAASRPPPRTSRPPPIPRWSRR